MAIDNLRFAHKRGAKELFDGLTHSFPVGAMTAVTGPSGRGKSTLLYVMGLMLRPHRGAVLIDGVRVDDQRDANRARVRAQHIGFVFQDAALDPTRRVIDAVCEPALYAGRPRKEAEQQARELLNRLEVGDRSDHRPGEISGGQAQRVALARALVNTPTVVLADEPTGNLDRVSAGSVLNAMRSIATGKAGTVVIATHDPFVLDQCDFILALT